MVSALRSTETTTGTAHAQRSRLKNIENTMFKQPGIYQYQEDMDTTVGHIAGYDSYTTGDLQFGNVGVSTNASNCYTLTSAMGMK